MMTLRFKTVMGVALIEAFLLALLIFTVMSHQRASAESSLHKRATTTATLFASTTKDPLLSLDLASLQAFSEELLANPDLVYVRVLDTDGNTYAAAGDEALLQRPFIEDTALETVTDHVYDATAPISESGIDYGHVELGFNIDKITAELDDTRQLGISIAVVEMLLVALFSFLLGTYLTGQLRILQKAAKKIAQGDFAFRIRISGRDEVAEVANSFNRMSTVLEESKAARDKFEQDLIDLNHTLEERVERRTAKINSQMEQLKAAKHTIEQTQAKLVQSAKLASVGQLAAGVAHEINNPIAFVQSNLKSLVEYVNLYQALLKKYQIASTPDASSEKLLAEIRDMEESEDIEFVEEDIVELLNDSLEGTTRVRDIVKGLKDFSHMGETGKEACCVNECIRSTLKITKKGMKSFCEVKTDLGALPEIMASPGELKQVLMNLLVNAGQAIEESGTIEVSTRLDGEFVEIVISDDGCGIGEQDLEKLYDPFFTTKPVGEGTGLGLAISYGVVQDHHGEIRVDSTVGEGTTFTVRLPVSQSEMQEAA